MSQLQDNLTEILRQKNAYLLPENLKNGVTVLGVTGTLQEDKPDQTKTVTPTTSEQIITPDSGYELASVTVEGVTSSIDQNITANNIKNGISILGVAGEYFGDMKLFDTIPHMQADTNPHDGDLATIYRTDTISVTSDTVFSKLQFSDIVVLDEAFTDDAYCRFGSVDSSSYGDCNVELSGTSFRLDFWGNAGSKRVQYTSSDGITYTRTSSDEEIDFGMSLKFEDYGEPFPTTIGKFMITTGNTFEGLYKYDSSYLSDEYISPPVGVNITSIDTTDNANIAYGEYSTTLSNNISISRIIEISELVRSELGNHQYGYYSPLFYVDENGNYVYIQIGQPSSTEDNWTSGTGYLNEIFVDSENNFIGCSYMDYSYLCKYAIVNPNTEDATYGFASKIGYTYKNPGSTRTDGKIVNRFPTSPSMIPVQLEKDYNTNSLKIVGLGTIYVCENTNYYAYSSQMSSDPQLYANDPKYLLANTQLSNLNPSSILPGIKAYGNNGIVEGDGTIYNNLDSQHILETYYQLTGLSKTYDGISMAGTNSIYTGVNSALNISNTITKYYKKATDINEFVNTTFNNRAVITTSLAMPYNKYYSSDLLNYATINSNTVQFYVNDVLSRTINVLESYTVFSDMFYKLYCLESVSNTELKITSLNLNTGEYKDVCTFTKDSGEAPTILNYPVKSYERYTDIITFGIVMDSSSSRRIATFKIKSETDELLYKYNDSKYLSGTLGYVNLNNVGYITRWYKETGSDNKVQICELDGTTKEISNIYDCATLYLTLFSNAPLIIDNRYIGIAYKDNKDLVMFDTVSKQPLILPTNMTSYSNYNISYDRKYFDDNLVITNITINNDTVQFTTSETDFYKNRQYRFTSLNEYKHISFSDYWLSHYNKVRYNNGSYYINVDINDLYILSDVTNKDKSVLYLSSGGNYSVVL